MFWSGLPRFLEHKERGPAGTTRIDSGITIAKLRSDNFDLRHHSRPSARCSGPVV